VAFKNPLPLLFTYFVYWHCSHLVQVYN